MSEEKLLPCPFHTEALILGTTWGNTWPKRFQGRCECGARGPYRETPEDAIEAWNKRPLAALGAGEREAADDLAEAAAKAAEDPFEADADELVAAVKAYRQARHATPAARGTPALDHLLSQLDQPDSTHVWSREDVLAARAELAALRAQTRETDAR